MHLRSRIAAALALAALVSCLPATVLAAKEAPTGGDAPRFQVGTVPVGGPTVSGTVCVAGHNGRPLDSIDYFLPPDDTYYTLLDPAACTACAGVNQGVLLETGHIFLDFRVNCTIQIDVSVVGVTTGPECGVFPDPNTVLCPVQTIQLTPNEPGIADFAFPITSTCCLSGKAFLSVALRAFPNECADELTRPQLVFASSPPCPLCSTFNFFQDGGTLNQDDLCGHGFPGPPVHYADASCCMLVPTLPTSWGAVKARYYRP